MWKQQKYESKYNYSCEKLGSCEGLIVGIERKVTNFVFILVFFQFMQLSIQHSSLLNQNTLKDQRSIPFDTV